MKKVILLPFTVQGEKVFFEDWKLPAKGSYPERNMKAICFYDLEEQKVDRMNCTSEEFSAIKWLVTVGDDEQDVSGSDEFMDFYGRFEDGIISPTVELVIEPVKRGRFSIDTLVAIKKVV